MKNFIDPQIQDVVLESKTRGCVVTVKWNNSTEESKIHFSTKKEGKYYYDWVTGNPNHPVHKNNKMFNLV